MGLDVNLCRFKDLDSEAILEFSRASSELWALEAGAGPKLKAKARELGLPEHVIGERFFGGEGISFPSKKHPKWPPVGDWSSFGMTRELMEHFTGKDLYFVFPEAEGNPAYFRPDWSASRRRLAAILEALQKLNPAQIEDYHAQFVMPHVPQFLLEKLEPTQLASAAEVVAGELAQIEVMIETLDYVLNHDRPQEFLLRWSV